MTRVGLISDCCLTSYLKNNEPKQVSKTPTQTQDIQPIAGEEPGPIFHLVTTFCG